MGTEQRTDLSRRRQEHGTGCCGRMGLTLQAEQGLTGSQNQVLGQGLGERRYQEAGSQRRKLLPPGQRAGTFASETGRKVALNMRWRAVPGWGGAGKVGVGM